MQVHIMMATKTYGFKTTDFSTFHERGMCLKRNPFLIQTTETRVAPVDSLPVTTLPLEELGSSVARRAHGDVDQLTAPAALNVDVAEVVVGHVQPHRRRPVRGDRRRRRHHPAPRGQAAPRRGRAHGGPPLPRVRQGRRRDRARAGRARALARERDGPRVGRARRRDEDELLPRPGRRELRGRGDAQHRARVQGRRRRARRRVEGDDRRDEERRRLGRVRRRSSSRRTTATPRSRSRSSTAARASTPRPAG